MSRLVPFLLIVCTSLLLCGSLAHAEDEQTREDSAAARLFREGWWLETGAGALDRAATQYEKAVTAEGSEAVRARALYRLAIVRHRMGQTDQAIRDLDRLTKSFAEQSKLLVQAKARLEEWTAEDLRGAFAEWYRRYQYSPEFQAKVVDTVLQLGSSDHARRNAAYQELLTIGEPAVQALRQHVTSNNGELRESAVKLLFQLGVVPPAYGLLNTHRWRNQQSSWERVLNLDGDEKAALLKSLEGEEGMATRQMRLALTDPGRVIDLLDDSSEENGYVNTVLLFTLMARGLPEARLAQLRTFVTNPDGAMMLRTAVAGALSVEKGNLTEADVFRWAKDPDSRIRRAAWSRLYRLKSRTAWRVAVEGLEPFKPDQRERQSIVNSLVHSLRDAEPDTDITPAYDALVAALKWPDANQIFHSSSLRNALKNNPLGMRLIGRLIETTRSQFSNTLMQDWWNASDGTAAATAQYSQWAHTAVDPATRLNCARQAAQNVTGHAGVLMQMMKTVELRKELGETFFQGLRSNRNLLDLEWGDDDLRSLVVSAAAPTVQDRSPQRTQQRVGTQPAMYNIITNLRYNQAWVFNQLLGSENNVERLVRIAAKDPVEFESEVWGTLHPDWKSDVANQQRIVRALQGAWGGWTDVQRRHGLAVFLHANLIGSETVEERDRFLRGQIESASKDLRSMILVKLSAVTLADVRAAFDLNNPESVDEAAGWIKRLEPSEAVYEAFKLAIRPSSETWAFRTVYDYIGKQMLKKGVLSEATQSDFIDRILSVEDDVLNHNAVLLLKSRNTVKDMPLWLKALTHKNAANRSTAASTLGAIFNDDAIAGLTDAIDDPNPSVRDAALLSLERIRKIQEQKAFWKDRANKSDGK